MSKPTASALNAISIIALLVALIAGRISLSRRIVRLEKRADCHCQTEPSPERSPTPRAQGPRVR